MPTAAIRPVSLWHNRDFLLLWGGQMMSAVGSQVSLLAFPWLILAVTGSPVQAGMIAAIRTLPYILFGLPASKLATGLIFAAGGIGSIFGAFIVDPLARRFSVGKLMIVASWLWTLTWLFFAFAPNPLVLSGAVATAFIIVPIHSSVQYGYRLASIPDKLQGRVNSIYRLILFGSQAIGLLLTDVLLQAIGPVLTVLVLFVPQFILAVAATLNRPLRSAPRLSEVRPL